MMTSQNTGSKLNHNSTVCNVAPGSTSVVPVSSVIASRGYIPHELIDGVVSEKTDCFSYGIVSRSI